ncbi:uncharacterized protein At2g24330-like isoform X1 [Malania oleifera]|uniref:uncharacterized protein At2g24330-like isoform X1 n=1 Tax=Malania oleifera TaxID=397392 RepID=UPI0025ADDC31|nr:uncharacterized protein At2g24330-like isoform X1 [Malania oleifera]
MANETSKDQAKESSAAPYSENKDTVNAKGKWRGIISRIWNGLFRIHSDDFEKRLQHISKEEASVLARKRKRSQSWRRMARHIIIFSVIFEVIAVGYAIMTTRSTDLDWKMRASRVLPMFLLPGLSAAAYSALMSFVQMCDRKDQKTLERLRAERQAKIDELKEKTNYYITQQLIQRYDTDPTAKAAAATVLASKLGADSGLTVRVGDEPNQNMPKGKSNDVEFVESSGLRNRKHLQTKSSSPGSRVLQHSNEEMPINEGAGVPGVLENREPVVEHHDQGSSANDGGWFARIAALLVGEDPTQSYALVCGNCHMHNGEYNTRVHILLGMPLIYTIHMGYFSDPFLSISHVLFRRHNSKTKSFVNPSQIVVWRYESEISVSIFVQGSPGRRTSHLLPTTAHTVTP